MIRDNGDKISTEDKEKLEKAIEKAKEDFKSDDVEVIRKAIDTLSKENEPIITKLYQEAAQNAQANSGNGDKETVNPEDIVVEDPDTKN